MFVGTALVYLRGGFHIFTRFSAAIVLVFVGILCWILFQFVTTTPSIRIKELTVFDPSCHHVRICHANGSFRIEQRCYPVLINFAHQCCQKAQEQNCQTGLAHGIRQCLKLNMQIFDDDQQFAKRNKDILNRKRGAGYWLWKSYGIYRELYYARDGDIIVYSDSAVDFIGNIQNLVRLTEHQDVIVFTLVGWKVRIRNVLKQI